MTLSLRSLGELSFGELPSEYSLAETSLFNEILKDPDAQFIYLVELAPYNETISTDVSGSPPFSSTAFGEFDFSFNGAIQKKYFSDVGFLTEPSDSPSNTIYLPLASNTFQFEVSIFQGDDFRGGIPSFGAIRLLNGDHELDDFESLFWSGRNVTVYAGQRDFARSQFERVFEGIITYIEFDEEEIIVNIGDKSSLLETEFSQSLYTGLGDLEGGLDLKDSPKPLLYGECLNVTPVLVDSANLIYQVHDGQIESIDAVYDKGVSLTNGGDVADITAVSASAGQFKTQLSGGYIKLGSTPEGRITADVKGDASGTGYVNTIGAVIQRLVKTKLGSQSFSDSDIDGGAFNSFDATISGKIGFYIENITTARDLIETLVYPVGGYWSFTRQGLLTLGVIDEPTVADYTITEDQLLSLSVLRVYDPTWRIVLGYAKNWTRQTLDDLAAAATNAVKTFVVENFRSIASEDRNIRLKTAAAVQRAYNSLFVDSIDAETVLTRLDTVHGVQRKIYRIEVQNLLFRVYVGDVVNLESERYNLESGKKLLITNISEDLETGTTTLELWG